MIHHNRQLRGKPKGYSEDEFEEDQAGNAAAVACYARGSGELEAAINPVTLEDLVRVRNALLLSSEDALILQLAVQGLDLPNAPTSAREFCQILHT